MNRQKSSRGKHSLLLVVASLGLLVLGAGCVWWASTNIGAQSRESVDAHRSPSSTPTTVAVGQVGSAGDDAAPTQPGKVLYAAYPVEGERVGTLSIPALKQTLPIIEGTDADELKKGIGHFAQSVLPGEADNCVLSGHRDTVFRRLGELKIGDRFIVQTSAGTFTYKIKRIRIVHKDDRTVIVPFDHAVLTVTTCYPFRFIGNAPDRYILVADLVTHQ